VLSCETYKFCISIWTFGFSLKIGRELWRFENVVYEFQNVVVFLKGRVSLRLRKEIEKEGKKNSIG
jgi:hypothetical protein